MISTANHKIRSLEQLSKTVDDIQKQMDIFKGIAKTAATIVAIAIGFLALSLAGYRFVLESPKEQGNESTENSTKIPPAPPDIVNVQNGAG
jgi:hypothetical protein